MKVRRKQLRFVPLALIIGGTIFAIGHSMRPRISPAQTTAPAADAPLALASSAPAMMASLVPAPLPEQLAAADEAQVHTGTIVSMNGELFILRDNDSDTWYHLDDQRAAASYLGKKVQVKGDVDPATDVIHVQSIQEEKA